MVFDLRGDGVGKKWGNGVSYLNGDAYFGAPPLEGVWE
jgi:hypothetical protein